MDSEKRENAWVAAGLAIMALVMRLVGIAEPSLTSAEVNRLDFGGWSASSLLHHFSTAQEPPIYELVAGLWGLVSHGAFWMRLLSALIAAGSVAAAYYLIKRKITKVTALLAAIFLVLHPGSIAAGQEAGPAALATLWIVLASYYAAEWLSTHGERAKLPTVIFSVLALYTHNYGWFFVLFLGLAMLSSAIRPGFQFRHAFIPFAAVVLLGLPWLPIMVRQAAHGMITLPNETLAQSAEYVALRLPFGVDTWMTPTFSGVWPVASSGSYALDTALWAIFAYVALLGIWGGLRHPFFGLMFSIALILTTVLRRFMPTSISDMSLFMPAGAACVAAGIGELARRTILGRAVAAISAVLIAGLAFLGANDVQRNPQYNQLNWRRVGAELGVARERAREWVVVYSAESAAGLAPHAAGPWTIKPLAETDADALALGPKKLAEKAAAVAPLAFRVALVDYEGERFDPEAEVIKTLATALGQPTFKTLPGYPKTFLVLFPDRRTYDYQDHKLFWLMNWR